MRNTAEPAAEVGASDRIRTAAGELARHRDIRVRPVSRVQDDVGG